MSFALFAAVIAFIVFIYVKFGQQIKLLKTHYDFAKTLPGPPFLEILGKTGKNILPWHLSLKARFGSIYRIWFGKDLFIIFSEPDDLKEILSSNTLITKSTSYDLVRPWLGNGLLTNSGIAWHQRRKLLTPAFHFKILGSFKKPMEEKCDIMLKKLSKVADGKTIDILPYISLLALDIISETAMGTKKYIQEKSDSAFVTATQEICHVLFSQVMSIWNRFSFIYNLSDSKKQRDRLLRILHGETERTIDERRSIIQSQNIKKVDDIENSEVGIKRRLGFLDILLLSQQEGANLTDKDIREEVDTFMFEGHDTTSSSLSFAILLLSKNPEIQKMAYEEAKEMEGRENETMKYMEAIIKETIRLYPPVAFYSRRTTEPTKIGKVLVPVGCSVSIQAYLLHHNPEIYPDPFKFKPDRFLGDKEYHPYAFIGFSAGPRNCIGQKFAMLELKCTLSKMLRAFEFLPVDDFEVLPVPELVMKSGNGIKVKLLKRSTQ